MILKALGIGRPAERAQSARPHERHIFRSAMLKPWSNRFGFGWVLSWDGLYWHHGIGIKGDDFNDGDWLGGQSWRRGFGPIAHCKHRRRGSLRCDIQFERNMGCSCQHLVWRWVRGNGNVVHDLFCVRQDHEDHERDPVA